MHHKFSRPMAFEKVQDIFIQFFYPKDTGDICFNQNYVENYVIENYTKTGEVQLKKCVSSMISVIIS